MATRRACDICYRRKIQCSIPSPGGPCNWCSHHGKECTFNRETPRRSSRRSRVTLGHVQELLQRIQQLEEAQGQPSSTEGSTASPVSTHTDGTVVWTDDDQGDLPISVDTTVASCVDGETSNSAATVESVASSQLGTGGDSRVVSPRSTSISSVGRSCTSCTGDQYGRLAVGRQDQRPRFIGSSTDHPASLSTAPQDSGRLAGLSARIHPLHHCMGPNWFFNGMPIFSEQGRQWLASRTGQTVDWTRFRLLNDDGTGSGPLCWTRSPLEEQEELNIGKETVHKVVAVYAASSFRLFFPVLDPVLTRETIEAAFAPVVETSALSTHRRMASRACILAALSVLGRLERCRQVLDADGGIDTEWCVDKARALVQANVGDASLETLQAALLLYLRQMSTGRWQEAAFLLSTACRIVSALGGHLDPSPSDQPGEEDHGEDRECRRDRHVRQLFWLCYMLDKDLCLRTGHTPLLTGEYCDLTLPDNYTDCYYSLLHGRDEFGDDADNGHGNNTDASAAESGTPRRLPVPHLPGDPRLSILKERIYRELFSARALRSTDGLLVHIRQLDVDLEQWRQSVPAAFRPMLAIPTTTPWLAASSSSVSIPQRMHYVHLQLAYHQLITIIHTTVRRYSSSGGHTGGTATGSADTDDERARNFHTVIHSSVDLSLEASRSTLWCLRELLAHFGGRAFRFIIFYPTTAAMSLFLNMVVHPLDEEAQLDVERLLAAANVIRSMPTEDLTADEADKVRDTSNFILGLVWLGTAAITGATSRK